MRTLRILALSIALTHGPLLAGVVFEIETKDHGQSPPREERSEFSVDEGNLRIDSGLSPERKIPEDSMVFRGKTKEALAIDHADRSYMIIDSKAVKGAADQMSGVMKQFEEQMKNVPEDKRAMIEQLMKQHMEGQPAAPAAPTKIRTRKTGERAERHGYPCVKYETYSGEERIREMWVTDWSNLRGGDEIREAFLGMIALFGELAEAFQGMGGMGPQAEGPFGQMGELDGFPVVTREFENGELNAEHVLKSARQQAIDPDAFESPKGYKLRTMGPSGF